MCRDVTKGTLRRENKIKLCIACSRGHSADHCDTKIKCLAQFLKELLRILSF